MLYIYLMGGNGSYPDLLWGTKLVTQISGISSPTDTFSSDVQNPQHGTIPNPCLGGQDVSGIFWVPSCLKPGPWAIAYEPRRCPQLTWANGGSESWPATAESAEGGAHPLEIWPRNRPRCSLYKLVKGINTRLGCEAALPSCWQNPHLDPFGLWKGAHVLAFDAMRTTCQQGDGARPLPQVEFYPYGAAPIRDFNESGW